MTDGNTKAVPIAYADLTPHPNPLVHLKPEDGDVFTLSHRVQIAHEAITMLAEDAITIRDQHRQVLDALKTRLRIAMASTDAWRDRALVAEARVALLELERMHPEHPPVAVTGP